MTDTNRPRILLSTSPDPAPYYFEALSAVGCQPVGGYLPQDDGTFDGLLLCGGGDIESTRFGEANCGSNPPDRDRDALEFPLVERFLAARKPILGICRGMQVLNVALGGGILQDLPPETAPFHSGGDHLVTHPVRAAEGSLFDRLYGRVFSVNSYHHQAVGRLGRGLVPLLWSESGIVEGFCHQTLPILGVQFHPERMTGQKLRSDCVDGGAIFEYYRTRF